MYSQRTPRFRVRRAVSLTSSCTNRLSAFTRSAGVAGSAVSVADDSVPVRNVAIVPKLRTPPVPPLKLLLRKRRNSAPNRIDCRPWTQPSVSSYWNVVSPRPWGNPLMPPNSNEPPATLTCGNTEEGEAIPKSPGLALSSWMKSMRTRFSPARKSLVTDGEKMCV